MRVYSFNDFKYINYRLYNFFDYHFDYHFKRKFR